MPWRKPCVALFPCCRTATRLQPAIKKTKISDFRSGLAVKLGRADQIWTTTVSVLHMFSDTYFRALFSCNTRSMSPTRWSVYWSCATQCILFVVVFYLLSKSEYHSPFISVFSGHLPPISKIFASSYCTDSWVLWKDLLSSVEILSLMELHEKVLPWIFFFSTRLNYFLLTNVSFCCLAALVCFSDPWTFPMLNHCLLVSRLGFGVFALSEFFFGLVKWVSIVVDLHGYNNNGAEKW